MIKVVIFSGGGGSVSLQTGLARNYGLDNLKMDIILNAYDNGKSTGACRRIFHDEILGPSDIRKNHLLQFQLRYADRIAVEHSEERSLNELFSARLSGKDAPSYYMAASELLAAHRPYIDKYKVDALCRFLDFFFFEEDARGKPIFRREVLQEDFSCFALSNIFYASCAVKNANSMEKAADIIAALLGIPSCVHLISNVNLFLQAETATGRIIEDEGKIVAWDDSKDKISRVMLTDGENEYIPALNEGSDNRDHRIDRLIHEADIIIFSSGTQWSSLIPTYMHRGLREIVHKSPAKKYLIMNNVEDRDSLGVGAEEWCEILNRYIDLDDVTVVVNSNAAPLLQSVPEGIAKICRDLGEAGQAKHHPDKLAFAIMMDYYHHQLICSHQMFDLDGTLWNSRGTEYEMAVAKENLALFNDVIVTGNSVEHVMDVLAHAPLGNKRIDVYADYGNTHFSYTDHKLISYLSDTFFLPPEVVDAVIGREELVGKVFLRGKSILTIKPVENREYLVERLNAWFLNHRWNVVAKIAGKTSVDIAVVGYTKAAAIRLIVDNNGYGFSSTLFVGNELDNGSEIEIKDIGIQTLQVDDVYECNTYLRTRAHYFQQKGN